MDGVVVDFEAGIVELTNRSVGKTTAETENE